MFFPVPPPGGRDHRLAEMIIAARMRNPAGNFVSSFPKTKPSFRRIDQIIQPTSYWTSFSDLTTFTIPRLSAALITCQAPSSAVSLNFLFICLRTSDTDTAGPDRITSSTKCSTAHLSHFNLLPILTAGSCNNA